VESNEMRDYDIGLCLAILTIKVCLKQY